MATLPKMLELAAHFHGDTKDKGGEYYILHLIRVMLKCETEDERMVAVGHDIIEDTDCTEEDLYAAGFSRAVVEGILSVTKRKREPYGEAIVRAWMNDIGRKVKRYDLEDNSNILRLPFPISSKNLNNLSKYAISHAFLSGKLTLEEFKVFNLQ